MLLLLKMWIHKINATVVLKTWLGNFHNSTSNNVDPDRRDAPWPRRNELWSCRWSSWRARTCGGSPRTSNGTSRTSISSTFPGCWISIWPAGYSSHHRLSLKRIGCFMSTKSLDPQSLSFEISYKFGSASADQVARLENIRNLVLGNLQVFSPGTWIFKPILIEVTNHLRWFCCISRTGSVASLSPVSSCSQDAAMTS